jgi:uncharacterized repeat protein (TIGR03803 family)
MRLKNLLYFSSFLASALVTTSSIAQSVSALHFFAKSIEGEPPGLLLSGTTLYGETLDGGSGNGSLFSLDVNSGNFQTLYSFVPGDGSNPQGSMGMAGNILYGTTFLGSSNNAGIAFSFDVSNSNFTRLFVFNDHQNGIVLASNELYGTAAFGSHGANGIVFAMDTNGNNFSVIHAFSSTDGVQPYIAPIVSGNTIYGEADYEGPTNSSGTIFSLDVSGSNYAILHAFGPGAVTESGFYTNSDGFGASGRLLRQGTRLVSATENGGVNGNGTIFSVDIISSNFNLLHTFSTLAGAKNTNLDGAVPKCNLVMDGALLLGTTSGGGANGNGTIFCILGSNFFTLYNFSAFINGSVTNAEGAAPEGTLIIAGNKLIGTTTKGGLYGNGTVFSMPLPTVVASNIVLNADSSVSITFTGIPNMPYWVVASTNLTPVVDWPIIGTNIIGMNGVSQFKDTNTSNVPVRFYRAMMPF